MASSNKTQHYDLSQFVPLDKPAWLGDYNSDMQKIDAGIYAAQTKADSLETEVETASTAATAAQQAAQTANEAAQQASDKAQDAETTANGVAATASQALTTAQQAQTTAQQAQTAASGALQTSGGTMTGPLVLNGDPTENLQAATKQYVDNNGAKGTDFINLEKVSSAVGSLSGGVWETNDKTFIVKCSFPTGGQISSGTVLVQFPAVLSNVVSSKSFANILAVLGSEITLRDDFTFTYVSGNVKIAYSGNVAIPATSSCYLDCVIMGV